MRGSAVVAALAAGALLLGNATRAQAQSTPDVLSLVNPFIGTSVSGTAAAVGPIDDFPGADVPFGMLNWSPDTPTNPPAGAYEYKDSTITGFGLTHVSGAGCGIFDDFRVTPTVGDIPADPQHVQLPYSHSTETATPGYYEVSVGTPPVRVQLTVTQRTGLGAFTFPASTHANLIVNSASDQATIANSSFAVDGPSEISGSMTGGSFCGMPNKFTVYFAMRFDRPFASYGTWNGSTLSPGSATANGAATGGWITFDTTANQTVRAQAAVSWVSVDGARANLNAEATTWDLDTVRAQAAAKWRNLLGEIQIAGGTPAEQTMFYTALYHALIDPSTFSDADGRYRGFDGNVHTVAPGHAEYANFSGWDIYRTQVPLMSLLAPHQASDMMQSLVDAAAQMGWLPKWPVANGESSVMGGDSADAILAGAYAFGARGFDTHAALRAMVKGATDTTSPPGQGWYVERQGLAEYLRLGYVTNTHMTDVSPVPNSASITLEYALDDFSIAQLAHELGNARDYHLFLEHSQNWTNLFDRATDLITPRDAEGAFVQTPLTNGFGQSGFQEGNAWQYTWMVPQNLGGLVYAMGGSSVALTLLDQYFSQFNAGPNSPHAWYGNEPSLGDAWTYLYAGAPYREQIITRQVMNTLYENTPSGIPGNDDLGTMSAWYAWNAMGLYPIDPSVPMLLVGSPIFTHVSLRSPTGTTITIDAPQASDGTPYVQSLRVNGRSTEKPWIALPLGTSVSLALDLGSQPNTQWGASPVDAPPSFGYGSLVFPSSTKVSLQAPAQTLSLAPGGSGTLAYGIVNPTAEIERVSYGLQATPSLQLSVTRGSVDATPHASTPVAVGVQAPQQPGLYDAMLAGRTANGALLSRATGIVRVANGPLQLGFVANFADGTVTPFDLRTRAFGAPIVMTGSPGAISLDANDTRLYVANQSNNEIDVIDTQSGTVLAKVKAGNVPAGIRVSPDGRSVWFANYDDGTVQSIDTATLAPSAPIAVGPHPEGVAFSPDGRTLYVVLQGRNATVPVDVATGTVGAEYPVGAQPLDVVVSKDGSRLYVSDTGGDTVSVLDARTGAAIATVKVGKVPEGLSLTPDGSLLLVADSGSGDVTPIDTATDRAQSPIPAGAEPFDVAVSADGAMAFAADAADDSCVPIDLTTRRALAPITAGGFPIAIVLPQH